MSYDLKIYTVKEQNYADLIENFKVVLNNDGFILPLRKSQIVVSNPVTIEDEDIPHEVSRVLPGIQYLIECNLEPFTEDKKSTSEFMKLAKLIAKNGHGVIENPQTDKISLPSGVKRVQEIEKTERFSIVKLSWWFNNQSIKERENLIILLKEIERTIPEALPRRYGIYEPPQEKFSGLDEFIDYLVENINDSIVWYPAKPVIYVNFSIPPVIGPTKMGYKFGRFSIEIDSAVLTMPGWQTSIQRLFKNISQVLKPFYGDIFVIDGYIRSRNGAWIDGMTGEHPIVSWWWNGFPRKSGLGLVLGEPLLNYVNIGRNYIKLNNGCKLFVKADDLKEDLYHYIYIPEGLFQPERKERVGIKVSGFFGRYPDIWPFDGPKII